MINNHETTENYIVTLCGSMVAEFSKPKEDGIFCDVFIDGVMMSTGIGQTAESAMRQAMHNIADALTFRIFTTHRDNIFDTVPVPSSSKPPKAD